ncbi:hypothetical protein ACJX0J_011702 [Zea mays]
MRLNFSHSCLGLKYTCLVTLAVIEVFYRYIFSCLGASSLRELLDFQEELNLISGNIPVEIGACLNITGPLPKEIGSTTDCYNNLSGDIPSELGNLALPPLGKIIAIVAALYGFPMLLFFIGRYFAINIIIILDILKCELNIIHIST